MELDDEVDTAYPARWIGKVRVRTVDGRQIDARVDEPKGDPGNTLSRPEIEDKVRRLGTYRHAATAAQVQSIIDGIWGLAQSPLVGRMITEAPE
jgi:2-methylcitrate dehydratase PrpD